MKKAKTRNFIVCTDHEDQPLVRVNPDPSSQKHVYCLDCLMQSVDSKTLYENSKKISDFIAEAAATLAEQKIQVIPAEEVPRGCLDVIARQGESLEKLSKHIAEEKRKIETFFEDITNVIIDALFQLKNEYLKELDKQVTSLYDNYVFFEKMVKRLYPKKEDIDIMFPSREVLEERLTKVSNALELEKLIKGVKQTLETNKDDTFSKQSDEAKQRCFDQFDTHLKSIEHKPPFFQQNGDIQDIKNQMKKELGRVLELSKPFTLKNEILKSMFNPDAISFTQSAIIGPGDFLTLKEWLPNSIAFKPKLLYKMTRDGKSSQAFHSLCDKKGPTITLIKCKYEGASNVSIIGGFSDQDYGHPNNNWVQSNQCFLFSFYPGMKYRLVNQQYAFWGGSDVDIWFGANGTIGIKKNFSSCASLIYEPSEPDRTYEHTEKMIPSEIYEGYNRRYNFILEEIEVYTVE